MSWPADDGRDDLEALLAVVRAGTWLRAPRQTKEALHFVAGFVQARPEASLAEVATALRAVGLGPLAWQAARDAAC